MITFQDTYDNRKKEIENFLELMTFLEKKEKIGCSERSRGERIGYFSEFKYCGVAASMKEMPAINLESRVGIFRGVTESMTS